MTTKPTATRHFYCSDCAVAQQIKGTGHLCWKHTNMVDAFALAGISAEALAAHPEAIRDVVAALIRLVCLDTSTTPGWERALKALQQRGRAALLRLGVAS